MLKDAERHGSTQNFINRIQLRVNEDNIQQNQKKHLDENINDFYCF